MPLKVAFQKAGESTLVELDIEGKKLPVLFHDIDRDPVTDRLRHVDFYAVDMKKEVEATVTLLFEGEALAVKELGGILVTPVTHIQVKCLPMNLPHHITVPVTSLAEMHAVLTVADIAAPKGVKILEHSSTVIATVQEPRAEEEIAPPAAEVPAEGEAGAAAPTTDGAIPAEGAAAAPAAGGAPAPSAEKPLSEKKGKKEKA